MLLIFNFWKKKQKKNRNPNLLNHVKLQLGNLFKIQEIVSLGT